MSHISLFSFKLIGVVFQTNEKLIEHLWAPNLHFLTTERWLLPLGKELILSYRPDWNGSQPWRTPAQWRSSGTAPCTTTATSDSQLVSFDASTPMFATNVRARPLVSCICTPALSPCIQYCQISKWDKYTKVMLSGTCFMSFTNYPLDEQLCRVLSVSHSNSIHEVEIGHILLFLWEVACCRLCCGARYRTTQSSNGPCSTSLSSDTSRTTTRLWSWRTQCILYRYVRLLWSVPGY